MEAASAPVRSLARHIPYYQFAHLSSRNWDTRRRRSLQIQRLTETTFPERESLQFGEAHKVIRTRQVGRLIIFYQSKIGIVRDNGGLCLANCITIDYIKIVEVFIQFGIFLIILLLLFQTFILLSEALLLLNQLIPQSQRNVLSIIS